MNINSTNIPFWRDIRVLRVLFQVLFLVGVFVLAGILYTNMQRGLNDRNLAFNLNFLGNEAGFDISEGIEYNPSDSYLKAFFVGVLNTLKISLIGIVCATLLGLFFGISRLSSNWLVRNIATAYVECFRNIPLLLQILFWFGITGKLPHVSTSIQYFDSIFINNRAINFPLIQPTSGFSTWVWYLLVAVIVAFVATFLLAAILHFLRLDKHQQADNSGFTNHVFIAAKWVAAPAFLIVVVIGWILTPESPFVLDRPELRGFNYVNGMHLSSQFFSLLIGLSVYTSAYIAEIVRSGIQAVTKGQREAARAVGLKAGQMLRLIILPQAVPIIIPPLTSQYLNLVKNSSLAVAIGFPDLFSIGNTMQSQTGQSIPVFAMIMVSYLTMSLTTSAAMNWYNSWSNRFGK